MAILIGLSPVAIVLILRLPLINQLNYADAWFYSSYAWVPKHDFALFGWNYFAARFPSILPIAVFSRAFGPRAGYVVLRYLLAVACASSVYLCVKKSASRQAAAAAAVLLYMQPFFSRSLLWDYTFVELAGGVIGVSLWYWSEDRRLAWTLLPGAALACSAFANANIAVAILVLIVVESVSAMRLGRRALIHLAARFGMLVVALVGVFIVGYLSYSVILGFFDPYDMLRPTIDFLRENSKNSAPYVRPPQLWLLHEPRLWMPVVTSVGLIATLRRRVLGLDLAARIAQLCIALTGFIWIYRFAVTSSVVEVWWSYDIVVVATAPALGVLLYDLTKGSRSPGRWIWAAVAISLFSAILIRSAPSPVDDIYRAFSTHRGLLLALLGLGVLAAALLRVRNHLSRVLCYGLFAVILAFMSYAPSVLDGRGTTGIFATSGTREWRTYDAGERFMKLVQAYDGPSHRVFLWWPGTEGPVNITWADLPQSGDSLNLLGTAEPLDRLTPLGAARLGQPTVASVMILAPRPSEVSPAVAALGVDGFHGDVLRAGTWADGELHYALVGLTTK